jgi:hypothetical protein
MHHRCLRSFFFFLSLPLNKPTAWFWFFFPYKTYAIGPDAVESVDSSAAATCAADDPLALSI